MPFSKALDKFGKIMMDRPMLLLSVLSSFSNTGVILTSSIDDGNIPSANDLSTSSRRIAVTISILSWVILVGILESCAASELHRLFNSFSISFAETFSKWKVLFVFL